MSRQRSRHARRLVRREMYAVDRPNRRPACELLRGHKAQVWKPFAKRTSDLACARGVLEARVGRHLEQRDVRAALLQRSNVGFDVLQIPL